MVKTKNSMSKRRPRRNKRRATLPIPYGINTPADPPALEFQKVVRYVIDLQVTTTTQKITHDLIVTSLKANKLGTAGSYYVIQNFMFWGDDGSSGSPDEIKVIDFGSGRTFSDTRTFGKSRAHCGYAFPPTKQRTYAVDNPDGNTIVDIANIEHAHVTVMMW